MHFCGSLSLICLACPANKAKASKPDIAIYICLCGHTESSEALLVGQKPKLRLLMRAVNSQGQRISAIPPLLSDDFVVSSQSVHSMVLSC